MNRVIRKGKFDAGHRVMHERFKCFNVHGHEYHYELEFSYKTALDLGYAIDFKEIKRVACAWIDETFDHAFVANPKDQVMINACREVGSALYVMHLTDEWGFCNPSAENLAKEIFYAVQLLMNDQNLKLERVRLHETVNCFVECHDLDYREIQKLHQSRLHEDVMKYKAKKGVVEYDERKLGDEEHA